MVIAPRRIKLLIVKERTLYRCKENVTAHMVG